MTGTTVDGLLLHYNLQERIAAADFFVTEPVLPVILWHFNAGAIIFVWDQTLMQMESG